MKQEVPLNDFDMQKCIQAGADGLSYDYKNGNTAAFFTRLHQIVLMIKRYEHQELPEVESNGKLGAKHG